MYGLDKDEIPNLPPNATYFERPKPKGDFMQYMPWTNIRIDSRKKYSLLFSSLLLNEKEDDLLDQFNKNSIIKLELDTDLALILGSLRPFFSWALNKESMPTSKMRVDYYWEWKKSTSA